MKLRDILKKDNVGLKLRNKIWGKKNYAILTKLTKKSFYLHYYDINESENIKRRFLISNFLDSDGWSIYNSDKIRKKLGIK